MIALALLALLHLGAPAQPLPLALTVALIQGPDALRILAEPPAFDAVELEWDNGTVPPPFYRERHLDLSAAGGSLTVRDYEREVSHVEFPVGAGAFASLQQVVRAAELRVGTERPAGGCAGGHPLSLTLRRGVATVLAGQRYRCGGADYGDLEGDVDAVLRAAQALVPPGADGSDG